MEGACAVGAVVFTADRGCPHLRLLLARAQELAARLASLVRRDCATLVQDMERFILSPAMMTAPSERVTAPQQASRASCKPEDPDDEGPGGASAALIDVYALVILQLVHGVLLLDPARSSAMIHSLCVLAFEAVILALAVTMCFARPWYKAHREPVQVAAQLALTALACGLLARPLATTLPRAAARSVAWFACCTIAEMLGSHAVILTMRFWIAVPLRMVCTALTATSLPTVCPEFGPLLLTSASCYAGGLARQWGVGFALPLALIYMLETRSRRAFLAHLQHAPPAGPAAPWTTA
ncbi:hypothetical protein WJX81_000983 [Elliptochloris bilobata]|uniref:Very-long-chain (3R)-3-hydroxyacyl-CoA dehydratase n=1 Tax=Elliptochloris bilobata TaxID=381761 RepID=A0AAW1S9D1_9CHLO